jgi:hypothetical protein
MNSLRPLHRSGDEFVIEEAASPRLNSPTLRFAQNGAPGWVIFLRCGAASEQQIPPLRFAPVGMTTLWLAASL